MDFKTNKCYVCGCEELIEISSKIIDGNNFHTYRCKACDETFSTEKSFKKTEDVICNEESFTVIDKNPKPLNTAKEVYQINLENTLTITGIRGEAAILSTGFMIGNGYILTNKHAVVDTDEDGNILGVCDQCYGKLENGMSSELEFVYADKDRDIALLYCKAMLNKVSICIEPVEVGDKVFSIGNSKGDGMCFLEGIVSDNERIAKSNKYILITVPVVTGNSGGPLFNEQGKLVGMIAKGRTNVQSMNYAVPVSEILDFIRDAEVQEEIKVF